jgi:peptidoglycan hydrolase FlgJ
MRIDGAAGGLTMGDTAARDKAKLADAAQQFEGMMLQELLKLIQSSENKWDSDDKDADKSMDTLSSYGTQAVATAISKSGGLGIAKSVVKQVTAEHENRTKKEH